MIVAEKARIKVAAVGGWLRAVAEAATEHGTAALPAVVAVAAGKALPVRGCRYGREEAPLRRSRCGRESAVGRSAVAPGKTVAAVVAVMARIKYVPAA